MLAVTLALGLVILGGVSLWGALTEDAGKNAAPPDPAPSNASSSTAASRHSGASSGPGRDGANTVVIRCLAVQCPVFVAGPAPTDVQFNGKLAHNEERTFSETRLTVSLGDASTVNVTINGRQQPRGRQGQQKIYRIPAQR